MWTGDMQGSSYPTQWALNPSAYQHLPNEQVDWATLAQQWIKMKETFPPVPPAPPPPSIKDDMDAGEAPMDMSKDDVPNSTPGPSQGGNNWSGWNNSWNQWGWQQWGGEGAATKPVPAPPFTYSGSNAAPFPPTDTPSTFDYNHGAPVTDKFVQQEYWSGDQGPGIQDKSSDWQDEEKPIPRRRSVPKVADIEQDTTTLFDAAKRKQLPAWIREGLEKMEREKQKKVERDIMLKQREEDELKRQKEEEEAIASGVPVKSKFDTDSEESEKETSDDVVTVKTRKSRFNSASPKSPKRVVPKEPSPPPAKTKNKEEIMQDVVQQMRTVLTTILMTVTNEEMQNIAEEVLADLRSKGSSWSKAILLVIQ